MTLTVYRDYGCDPALTSCVLFFGAFVALIRVRRFGSFVVCWMKANLVYRGRGYDCDALWSRPGILELACREIGESNRQLVLVAA